MAVTTCPWVFTMWWGELETHQLLLFDADNWEDALKKLQKAAGFTRLPAEYEVISAVEVMPEGLETQAVNVYFEAGSDPTYAVDADDEDEAAAGLWRKTTPKGKLNQYVITGTITDDDLRFTQNLNDKSCQAAVATVEKYYESVYPGAKTGIELLSAVELTPDGIVNAYWLDDKFCDKLFSVPAPGGAGSTAVQAALAKNNLHRARIGQKALDPAAAGWKPQDILDEAKRIARNPDVDETKARLLEWNPQWPAMR